jgi:hypothetical protein
MAPYRDAPAAKEGLDLGVEGRTPPKAAGTTVPIRRQFSLQLALGCKVIACGLVNGDSNLNDDAFVKPASRK